MSLKTIRDEERDLTINEIAGPVSEEEMYLALTGPDDHEPTRLLLWDMSRAEVAHVTPDILRKFVGKAAELGAGRQDGRTAVVAPDDLQFGLARMSEVFSELESAPYDFRAFRTRQEAFEWLGTEDPEQPTS